MALLTAGLNPSSGCDNIFAGVVGQTVATTFEFGGHKRSYEVFFPGDYDGNSSMPLVFSLHGWGGTSREDACDSGLTAVANNTSAFIVAHLQGMGDYNPWSFFWHSLIVILCLVVVATAMWIVYLQKCAKATETEYQQGVNYEAFPAVAGIVYCCCVPTTAVRRRKAIMSILFVIITGLVVDVVALPFIDMGNWNSWHFTGSTQNGGLSCSPAVWNQYCFDSNENCQMCDWTTGVDDVAYVEALFEHFEDSFCIDLDMEYVTGQSNGGMMTYQLGASLAHKLAAIAPTSGALMWDHMVIPAVPIPVFAVTGSRDTTVPGNGSEYEGQQVTDGSFFYYSMQAIGDAWAQQQQCDGNRTRYTTSYDGEQDLWCQSMCSNIHHVLCSWDGMHNYFTGVDNDYIFECDPTNSEEVTYKHGSLIWEFLSQHVKSDPLR